MDKRDSFIVVNPTQKSNNNLKKDPSHYRNNGKNIFLKYDEDIYYRDVLLEKLAQEIMRFEMYKAKISELEKRLERLERSKIVTAPLKEYKQTTKISNIDIKNLNKVTNVQKAVQAYSSNVVKVTPAPIKQPVALEVKEEKLSVWQKIKKAVKSFFTGEEEKLLDTKPEAQTWTQQNNYQGNMKYNQFRQSIPKTTIQIDVKSSNTTRKKEPNHILDRYV